jgi:transcriptional regulator with XRE-family HTH domain
VSAAHDVATAAALGRKSSEARTRSVKSTGSIDAFVGARIRARRTELGLTQEALANALGVSFQQVQKYEKGTNRLAVGTLVKAAQFLAAPIGYFLPEGDEPDMPLRPDARLQAAARETLAAIEAFRSLLAEVAPKARQ